MRSGTSRWPLARIALALLALATLAVTLLGCGSSGAGAAARTQAATSVTGDTVGNPIPAGFVGLSIELKALEQYAGTDPSAVDPVLVHLIQDIAPQQRPVLRLGGDSTDWTWWPVAHVRQPPGVKYALTPTWMHVARSLATQLRARLILGVDLEANSEVVASAEAQAMVNDIGRSSIDALELGNEPELYGAFGWYRSTAGQLVTGRPRGYDETDFTSNFSSFAPHLPSVALAGPSSGAPTFLSQLGAFLTAEPRVRLATVHAYPLKHCRKATVVTIPQLLSDTSSHGLAEQMVPYVAAATRRHAPLRIDEMNAISCGGTRGVSDTFASALWVLDTLFEMARTGVAGVNIHTVPGTINEVLGPEYGNGAWRMRVHPEYYGMIMFAQAAPAGARLLRIASAVPAGVKVWATRAGSTIHVVVINKRLAQSQTMALRIAAARGPAIVEQLRAPSVHATSGVTLGGQTFGAATSTGVLAGSVPAGTLAQSGGAYTVRVPAASATMLTITRP
ncbi:MAG TPA: glycosyl hydrolase family 79 C-terminal domain-containing protein [Solirubrobacteraceae bacterium]